MVLLLIACTRVNLHRGGRPDGESQFEQGGARIRAAPFSRGAKQFSIRLFGRSGNVPLLIGVGKWLGKAAGS